MILIVLAILGIIPKGLQKSVRELEITGRTEAIQSTKTDEISKEIERNPGNLKKACCHLNFNEKTPVKTCMKNSQRVITVRFLMAYQPF